MAIGTQTQSTIVAVFRSRSDASAAASELRSAGIDDSDIYIGTGEAAGGTATAGSEGYREEHSEGGITGWFKRVFGAEDDYEDRPVYEQAVKGGQVLLSVQSNQGNLDQVVDILNRHSPVDVHREAGTSSAGTSGASTRPVGAGHSGNVAETAAGIGAGAGARAGARNEGQAIPVVEEELKVGKRSFQRGGVRVYSRVVEQPVEETVRLREERVTVDRQPVNREVKASDLREGRDQVIEVKEYAEEPIVSKQARVVEEVRVNKTANERAETVRDTVRHTEVNVENLGREAGTRATGSTGTANFDDDFRKDFTTRYGSAGGNYDEYAPAYSYGYKMANDPRYKGRDFSQVESDLRSDYGRQYPNSTWERMKDAVRYGWDKVTGRSTAASSSR